LRWATPFGWLENIGAFQHRSALWSAPMLLIPVGIGLVAWKLQESRDIGLALWVRADRSRPRLMFLTTPWRFAWRERRSTFTAWALGLTLLGLTFGYLTNALVAFCRSDPAFVKLLNRWGYGSMVTGQGFVSQVCIIMAVALGFLAVTMLCMVATDAVQGRLDLPFASGSSRSKWMASAVYATALTTCATALVCGVATWAGVVMSGTSMSITSPLRGMLNALTTTPLIVGLGVLAMALAPRFSYIIMASLLSVFYIVALLGPTLNWPTWVLDLSPFHYLRLVPVVPTNWGATVVMTGLGVIAGSLGWAKFVRNDLAG
jgi:ABC-2 type transport system permease protein